MHRSRACSRTLLLSIAVMAAPGCSGSAGPDTFPVTGAVTQGGKPVEGVVLAFIPVIAGDAAGPAQGGQAQTAADGTFAVQSSFDQGKTTQAGLPAGEYKVTLVKMEAPAGGASFNKPPKNALPSKYAAAESTPVSATVTAEGPNQVDVSL